MAGLSEGDREKVSLFIDEMRAMREQHGWSRANLAREVNYSEPLITMVETYQRVPTLALAKALDRALGTPGFSEGAGADARGVRAAVAQVADRVVPGVVPVLRRA